MTVAQTFTSGLWRWLDQVAEAMIAGIARLTAARTIRLVEGENGQFEVAPPDVREPAAASSAAQFHFEDGKLVSHQSANAEAALRGSRVELVLRPDRFLFKPLELPERAAEFLAGVVRAQIDRLTPWVADDAAFGSSEPTEAGAGRIVVTVAATAKMRVVPYVQALTQLGVRSITMMTPSPNGPNARAIRVWDENVAGIRDIPQTRRILFAVLAAACLISATAVTAATIIGANLEAQQDDLAHRIAQRRSAALAARSAPGDPVTVAERALARRKNETPATVLVLETLSDILPDHTYVTEMRVEADMLRITGFTSDAPSLIRLMEQSRRFTHATFFAPTTRAPSDPGDRFSIEARILPVFSPPS
jgi:general secretion pathway protein L